MNLFSRLSAGWNIAFDSFKVLKENKQLIIFPILSGISLVLIMGTFVVGFLASSGWDLEVFNNIDRLTGYVLLFLYYVVNYFIVVFFNMALIHCTRLYFQGEEVTVKAGIQFSMSRIGVILSWSIFAATVGTVLRILQENLGTIGKIITGIIGIVWSIATFFVVPVIAYEDKGPIAAFKRSTELMKAKWGESLGANFSLGLVQLAGVVVVALPLFLIGAMFHILVGVALAVLGIFLVASIITAAQTIFISAVYHNVNGDPVKHFEQQMIDNLFEKKKK
jgi:hypothetical protein